ncbi:DNA primase family protein [Trinickia mobilis]|uniref:DNA primase family protein n=1 Tax=Trinickia mobilis TaxID=2816356 RepID=UPI001A8F4B89|nr:phage/plasmid primase, P4 family [Trinickia mobilis]
MKRFQPSVYAEKQSKTGNFAKEDSVLYRWTGTHWATLTNDQADEIAYAWLKARDRNHASAEHARRCSRALMLDAPRLAERGSELCIPCLNGYVTLVDDKPVLIEPDKTRGLRHVLNCHFEVGETRAPRFERFLTEVLPDAAVRERVQEYAGYTLTGDARHQRTMMFYGGGANGKSLLSNIIQALHGDGVGAAWLENVEGAALSGVIGKSLIVVDEMPQARLNEKRLKSLFGGERIPIDIKYATPISTRLEAKWMICGNYLPVVVDDSDGFWRRWDIVPFNVTIDEANRDTTLADAITQNELSAVLNWALAGLTRLQRRGRFDPIRPAAIEAMTEEAKLQSCSIRAWKNENDITVSVDAHTPKDEIFRHYRHWCERNLLRPVDSMQFWKRLGRLLPYETSRPRVAGGKQERRVGVTLPRAASWVPKGA